MSEQNAYNTTRRCEFEGIGKNVDNDLVKVAAVNPDGQLLGIVFVCKLNVLDAGLLFEERMYIAHKADDVCLTHAHLHLSLVNFAQVHHLVNESQYALSVTAYRLVDTPALRIVVLFDEREQWCDNQCHRGANLMADVHEESQLGIGHFLCVYVFLQSQAVLFLAAAIGQVEPYGTQQQ